MASKVGEELIEVVSQLVDEPEAIELEEEARSRSTVLKLRVAREELGRVIGRQGRTVRALRTLLESRQQPDGERYELEIVEPSEAD